MDMVEVFASTSIIFSCKRYNFDKDSANYWVLTQSKMCALNKR